MGNAQFFTLAMLIACGVVGVWLIVLDVAAIANTIVGTY